MLAKIAKNTVFLSVSQIIARTIGFFYFIFLGRFLGVELFGVYNFTLAFVYNFSAVADFGLERLALRDTSREPKKIAFYLERLLPLKFFLAITVYLVILLLGFILNLPLGQIGYLAVFGFFLFASNIIGLFCSFQNAREKMHYMAAANIATPLLTVFFGVPLVLLKMPLWVIFLAAVLAGFSVLAFFLKKASSWDLPLGWVIDKKFFLKALSQSWAFAFLIILAVFYLRLSIILVNLLKGNYYTGLYSSAFKFIEAMILIPQSLALALFPLSAKLFLGNKERLKKIYQKGLLILFFLSLPFVLVLTVFSKFIIGLAYGQAYLSATPVLSLLGASLILFFLNALPGNIIQNSPQFKKFLPWAALNFVITLVLCLILIPRYSIIGAAWAVIGGEVAGLFINNLFVWKILKN